MSAPIDLGTLFASVNLDTSKLATSRGVIAGELANISSALDRVATQAEKDGARIAEAAAGRKAQAAMRDQQRELEKQRQTWGQWGESVIKWAGGAAAAITAAGVAAAKMAGNFDQSLQRVQANTTMQDGDLQALRATVISLGKESGAAFDDLANGYMHAANFGNSAADSTNILNIAMKAAVATGAQTSTTANILAATLHMFGLKATDAGRAMNVLHYAAAQGNMTLEQFTAASGEAFSFGSQLGLSLTDISAAFSALTRNGFNAAEAGTQVKALFQHIIDPSKKAREEIDHLRKTTGHDLTADFTVAGLQAKGLNGVLDDMALATKGDAGAIERLIPAMRGGIGTMSLAGKGGKDLHDILRQLNRAWAGELDPTTNNYNKSIKNLNQVLAEIANELKADFLPAGERLADVLERNRPVIEGLAKDAADLLDGFSKLPAPVQDLVIRFGAMTLTMGTISRLLGEVGLKLPSLASGFGSLKTNVGLVTKEVEGLQTQLGLLQAIGPITLSFIVGWQIGTAVNDYLTEQFITPFDKQAKAAAAGKSAIEANDTPEMRRFRILQGRLTDRQRAIAAAKSRLDDLQPGHDARTANSGGAYVAGIGGDVPGDADYQAAANEYASYLGDLPQLQKDVAAARAAAYHSRAFQKLHPKLGANAAAKTKGGGGGGDTDKDAKDLAEQLADSRKQAQETMLSASVETLKHAYDLLLENYRKNGGEHTLNQLAALSGQIVAKQQQESLTKLQHADAGDRPNAQAEYKASAGPAGSIARDANDRRRERLDAEGDREKQRAKDYEDAESQITAAIRETGDAIFESMRRQQEATKQTDAAILQDEQGRFARERQEVQETAQARRDAGVDAVKVARYIADEMARIQNEEAASWESFWREVDETTSRYVKSAEAAQDPLFGDAAAQRLRDHLDQVQTEISDANGELDDQHRIAMELGLDYDNLTGAAKRYVAAIAQADKQLEAVRRRNEEIAKAAQTAGDIFGHAYASILDNIIDHPEHKVNIWKQMVDDFETALKKIAVESATSETVRVIRRNLEKLFHPGAAAAGTGGDGVSGAPAGKKPSLADIVIGGIGGGKNGGGDAQRVFVVNWPGAAGGGLSLPGIPGLPGGGGGGLPGIPGLPGVGGVLGRAMPWIGGGLLLNSILGNPLGKLGKGLKHLFHFDQGGTMAAGQVAAVAEPHTMGELVIPKSTAIAVPISRLLQGALASTGGGYNARGARGEAAGNHTWNVNVTTGDIRSGHDLEQIGRAIAHHAQQSMVTARPEGR